MEVAAAIVLFIVLTILGVAFRKKRVDSNTLQDWANIVTISSVISAVIVGVIVGVWYLINSGPIFQPKPTTTPTLTGLIMINVPANVYWYHTGITVKQGQQLVFIASGDWFSGMSWTGPEGDSKERCGDYPIPCGNLGALVGKVGDEGAPFRIGSNSTQVAPADGILFLAMNDGKGSCDGGSPGSCYIGNLGELEVKFGVQHSDSSQINATAEQTQSLNSSSITFLRKLTWPIAFSPDGKMVASGGVGNTIDVWNIQTGSLIKRLAGHNEKITSVAFSPDGKTLASGSGNWMGSTDTSVKLWSIETGSLKQTLWTVDDRTFTAVRVSFSQDGNTLVAEASYTLDRPSGHSYVRVGFWNMQSGKKLIETDGTTSGYWFFSPDGKRFAISDGWEPRTLAILNTQTGDQEQTLKGILGLKFSPDGKILVGTGGNNVVSFWDIQTWNILWQLTGVISVEFSPDGKILASMDRNGTANLWNMQTQESLMELQEIASVDFSPDGKLFAGWAPDKTVKLWDIDTWKVKKILDSQSDLVSISFSPDWKTAIYWNANNTVSLYDMQSGKLKGVLKDDSGKILQIIFSPDGRTMASIGGDYNVTLWNIN